MYMSVCLSRRQTTRQSMGFGKKSRCYVMSVCVCVCVLVSDRHLDNESGIGDSDRKGLDTVCMYMYVCVYDAYACQSHICSTTNGGLGKQSRCCMYACIYTCMHASVYLRYVCKHVCMLISHTFGRECMIGEAVSIPCVCICVHACMLLVSHMFDNEWEIGEGASMRFACLCVRK